MSKDKDGKGKSDKSKPLKNSWKNAPPKKPGTWRNAIASRNKGFLSKINEAGHLLS